VGDGVGAGLGALDAEDGCALLLAGALCGELLDATRAGAANRWALCPDRRVA
jgi:hypothetical protein